MTEAVVDQLEIVEVEYEQRQLAAVAVGARDLALEQLVEVALVVEPRERIEVRELTGLLVAARILDRGPRARRQLLDSRHLLGG